MKILLILKNQAVELAKQEILLDKGKGFIKVFCGSEELAIESLLSRRNGLDFCSGNIVPSLVTDMYNHVQNSEMDEAWALTTYFATLRIP